MLSVDFSSLSFTSARTFFRSDTCFHWARGKYRRQGKEMDLLTQIFSFRSAVPNLFSTRDQFHRRQFSHRPAGRGGEWYQDDSRALCFLYTFFFLLPQFHLRSLGIRSQRLGTPASGKCKSKAQVSSFTCQNGNYQKDSK